MARLMYREEGITATLDVTPQAMERVYPQGKMIRLLADALDEVKLPAQTAIRLHYGSRPRLWIDVLVVKEIGIEGLRILRDKIVDALDRRCAQHFLEKDAIAQALIEDRTAR